ncbi:PTS sugar transporter subunit IIB [uncultured Lactobacillus sp.]|uniref:PTS system mannose/fructose/N-acetylgalactosamine-transporter subunit IIB n=1 Tax=uncultured Lactobacillus sp. TaxID=153152 RepID=UPI0025E8E4B3|nr:PTS sugar transporter subunit IIB [uncultured Lactobacillus sp.]
MPIKWTRIDDRLIHGQVASSWLRHVGAEQIICISERAASNPVQEQVLKMAAPGYIVHVFGVDKFIRVYKKNPIKKTTFLILTSTLDLLHLIEGGVDIKSVNFGGMRERKERTIRYNNDLCFTPEEKDALDKLVDSGIEINFQMAAYDAPTPIKEYIEQVQGKN